MTTVGPDVNLASFGAWLCLTFLLAITAIGLLVFVVWRSPRSGERRLQSRRGQVVAGVAVLLLLAAAGSGAMAVAARSAEVESTNEMQHLLLGTNLVCSYTDRYCPWSTGITNTDYKDFPSVNPGGTASTGMMPVREGETYRYSLATLRGFDANFKAQARLLWLDRSLNVLKDRWNDFATWDASHNGDSFHQGTYVAPPGAAFLQLQLRNIGGAEIQTGLPRVTQDGVYIEQHPNGALGSLAFSFDWETAMGGAIHSRGEEQHDPQGAAAHGMEMRQGADWLADLFARNHISATFYATGYNLLDGNTERQKFLGDPIYRWANQKNGWNTDWWVTHPWYGDDPYGTAQSDPAWYFGDQTRRLLAAGHEIASHTFGHLYVRGSKPQELSDDMDQWLTSVKQLGVPAPTTFAFPWRSSNSLTPDFYQVLHDKGIRAVTRLYERDLKDLYTVGAVPVYTDIQVMPDFLLGVASANAGEETAGSVIGGDEGVRVISETIARRGTTSFWQHPEQLASTLELAPVRAAWEQVVQAAATERDRGGLWVATVADITAYQRDLRSVSTSLDKGSDGWTVRVNNSLDRPIKGMTLTLPGEAVRVTSSDTQVKPVEDPDLRGNVRRIVLPELKPGSASLRVEWVPGQEPQ